MQLASVPKLLTCSDAGFKQPLERCNLLTHWAFEYFDQTTSTFTMTPDHVIHSPRNGQSWQV